MQKKIKRLAAVALMALSLAVSAQQKYFVDGFHGGVYGHYPLATYTQFLVDQMDKHPQWFIGLEIEPETWDTVRAKTPEAYLAFLQKMSTPQVEYTNPSYAQPYPYCITGESLIRQFAYGIRKVRSHFPDVLIATYAVEEPCFTSCLPGILAQFGFRHIVLKCPDTCWGGYAAPFGGELVNLIGPDGTSMLSVPRYACEDLEPGSVWQTTAWTNHASYFKTCFDHGIQHPVGMTYQDAGWTGGPWIGWGDRKQQGTEYTRWTKYIEEQSVGKTDDNHLFSQEDVLPGLMWGSQVMQRLAQQCRTAEYMVPQAEKMAAMAQLANGFRANQDSINEAWRTLLLSQHHDCWIVPYNRLNANGNWAENVKLWTDASCSISQCIIEEAAGSFGAKGKTALKVFNASGYERTEVVKASLSDGQSVDVQVTVPAFGYQVIPADELTAPKPSKSIKASAKECRIETDQYSIVLDLRRGGAVKSLKAKSDGYEYATKASDYAMGELRGYFAKQGRFLSSTEAPVRVTVIEDNDLVKSVRMEGKIAGTAFQKTITLRKGSPVIDCVLTIDWRHNHRIGDFIRPEKKEKGDRRTTFYDTRYALSLMFPTSLQEAKLYKNAPFDVCESQLRNTFFNSWDSLKHNVILEWIDLESGKDGHSLALFTDHTTSYSHGEDYPLSLTVQYSGPGLWGRDYQITGPTTLRYALVPHTGGWDEARINQLSTAWNEPLIVTNSLAEAPQKASFISLDGTGLELVNVTREGDDLQLRLFNASGPASPQLVEVSADVASVTEVDFLGNERGKLPVTKQQGKSRFEVSMPRFGVRTYKMTINNTQYEKE